MKKIVSRARGKFDFIGFTGTPMRKGEGGVEVNQVRMADRKYIKMLFVGEEEGPFSHVRAFAEIWNSDFQFDMKCVESAQDAIESVREIAPSLIMIDAYLDDMNCFEFLKRMKHGSAPLVVATDHPNGQMRESVLANGAREYVSWTSDPDEIELLLSKLAAIASETAPLH